MQGNFSDVIGHLYHTNCTYIEMASYRSTSFAGFDSTESRQCTRTYTWALPGTVAATQGRSSTTALTIRPALMVMFQELTRTLKNFPQETVRFCCELILMESPSPQSKTGGSSVLQSLMWYKICMRSIGRKIPSPVSQIWFSYLIPSLITDKKNWWFDLTQPIH